MEPPLNFDLLLVVVLGDAESAPEVALAPETVMVLTWPPELVCTETVGKEVVVLSSEEVDEVVEVEVDVDLVEVEVDEVVFEVVVPAAVLVASLPTTST